MTRNVSSVVDDDVADFIEDKRAERGLVKSKAINILLRDLMNREKDSLNINQEKKTTNSLLDSAIKTGLIRVGNEEIKPEPKLPTTEPLQESKQEQTNQQNIPELKPELKPEPLKKEEPLQTKDINLNRLNDLVDKKIPQQNIIKPKEKKKMSEDEVVPRERPLTRADLERINREEREREKFNEAFKQMHSKINSMDDRICKDGECTKRELETIKNNFSEFKNLKNDFNKIDDIKKDLSELKDFKKELTELKKELPKLEVCPTCGENKLLHMSSYCSNCGQRIPTWLDDNGNKISNWKPFWERGQHQHQEKK